MRCEHCTLGQSELPSSGTQLLCGCSKIITEEGEKHDIQKKEREARQRVSKARHRESISFAQTTKERNAIQMNTGKVTVGQIMTHLECQVKSFSYFNLHSMGKPRKFFE